MKNIFVFALLMIFMACNGADTNCDTTNLSYTNGISEIMKSCNTAGCHPANSPNGSLANYTDTQSFINGGKTIFLGSIKHQSGYKAMPEDADKLSDCTINKLETWINAGMPE